MSDPARFLGSPRRPDRNMPASVFDLPRENTARLGGIADPNAPLPPDVRRTGPEIMRR